MGFDNDCVLNIQTLAGEYFCPVCHLLVYPNEALQAQCTHLYCKPCLKYVVSTTHACPYDGYRVTEADCKPLLDSNKALADTIAKIQVRCLYYRTGCTWQGSLSECSSHCSTCSFGESLVLCNRCSAQIVHRQAQEHTQSCPGLQFQAQQTGTVQDTTATGAGTQTGISGRIVSGQVANPASQQQAAMPTPEQWQQYQQYYQQYLGYVPYQPNYQYYYQYPQPMQGYPPQPFGQAQPQLYVQATAQQQVQPQQQSQVPSQVVQPQPAGNAPAQAHFMGQSQPQVQAQGQAPSYQALPYNHSQFYAQPQQQMPVPQYQQTSQVQNPHPQAYPPSQATQNYPYPHPHSYPQPQPHPQGQGTAAHLMSVSGAQLQLQYPTQMQGKFPAQPSQMYPDQKLPVVPFAQVQPPSGPTAVQPPVSSQSQQPGYLFQHRPEVQVAQQSKAIQDYGQQQSVPGHGPCMQLHPPMEAHSHAQGPPQTMQHSQQNYVPGHGAQHNMTQNYVARPVVHAVAGPGRPPQENKTYPLKVKNQTSSGFEQQAGHLQQPSITTGGEKPCDQVLDKSMHDQNKPNIEAKNFVGGSAAGVEAKRKPESALNSASNRIDSSIPVMGSFKHPSSSSLHENASEGILAPGSSGPFPRPYYQGKMPLYQAGQPQNPPGEPFAGSSFSVQMPDSHVGVKERERADLEQCPVYPMENEKFSVQRPGYFNGGKPESRTHGSLDRAAHVPVESQAMKFGIPPSHDFMSAPGMSEGAEPVPEEHVKHFSRRDFEDDFRKVAKPSHFETGSSSKYGTQFSSSKALDHGPPVFAGDGRSRSFGKALHGSDRNPGLKMNYSVGSGPSRILPSFHPTDVGERGHPSGFPHDNVGRGDFGHHTDFSAPSPPGFGQSLMGGLTPQSPGREFPSLPSGTFGAGNGGNSFLAEPVGNSVHGSRFPAPSNHLQRGDNDVPGNLLLGGPRNQARLPNHLQAGILGPAPRNMHKGETTHPRMRKSPLVGNFPEHLPVGGERSGFEHSGREGGFYREEMQPFNDPRKWKHDGFMCRICKIECGTVDNLELHSQSREHQKNAREMVLSIKRKNKKQKISKDQVSFERRYKGRARNSSSQGRGNKR